MADTKKPRKGSMAYWPRKKAKRSHPRIRGWSCLSSDKAIPLGFAGYKVGMTHVLGVDNRKTTPTKGEEISIPATVIECPPLKILCAGFYKKMLMAYLLPRTSSSNHQKTFNVRFLFQKKSLI
ncbi:MAG TPA: 50S ribosomal protein L3 [Candidatus Woesearchaeota archaeon]|nr:50S ribosomal protein L3 [Candidatus Woesearchaeota archaeon]